MERHTIVGEQILAPGRVPRRRARCSSATSTSAGTAPATRTASPARTIPLGSRIILACDALHAMTSRPPVPPGAVAEAARRGAAPPRRHAVRPARSSTRCSRCWTNRRCRRSWIHSVTRLGSAAMPRPSPLAIAALSRARPPRRRPGGQGQALVLRLARRLLRRRLPALPGRPARRTTRDGFAYQLVGKAADARLQAQARQLRLRRARRRVSILKRKTKCARPRPGRRELRRPHPGGGRRALPAQAPRPGRS